MSSPFDLYKFGISLGIKTIARGKLKLGMKSLLNPVRSGFTRYWEMPYVIEQINHAGIKNVLDVGSPKHAALFISEKLGKKITSIDIQDDFIDPYSLYKDVLGQENLGFAQVDATTMEYPDESFDAVYSISVLEHIPKDGDTKTIKEIQRVLKKDGKCILTMPYAPEEEDIYWSQGIYERKYQGKPMFFQRLYNEQSLFKRLIEPSGFEVKDIRYFTQTKWKFIRLDNPRNSMWSKLPGFFYLFLHPFGLIFAKTFLRYVDKEVVTQEIPGTVCLTLLKSNKHKNH